MFVNNNKWPQAMFLGKTVNHYNRVMVTHIENYIAPMTPSMQLPTTDSLRQFSIKSLLHFSNLPTVVHMEKKLCAHVYIVSMTTVNKKFPQALFPLPISSLLKLANHTMHGAEIQCMCISVFPGQPSTKNGLSQFSL